MGNMDEDKAGVSAEQTHANRVQTRYLAGIISGDENILALTHNDQDCVDFANSAMNNHLLRLEVESVVGRVSSTDFHKAASATAAVLAGGLFRVEELSLFQEFGITHWTSVSIMLAHLTQRSIQSDDLRALGIFRGDVVYGICYQMAANMKDPHPHVPNFLEKMSVPDSERASIMSSLKRQRFSIPSIIVH